MNVHRYDFSQLQNRFLEFLKSSEVKRLCAGVSGDPDHPGIRHVLVDEYQDTNLMQEANRAPRISPRFAAASFLDNKRPIDLAPPGKKATPDT